MGQYVFLVFGVAMGLMFLLLVFKVSLFYLKHHKINTKI